MNKEDAKAFTSTIEKYGIALCGTLYPSQMDQLQRAVTIPAITGQRFRNFAELWKVGQSIPFLR